MRVSLLLILISVVIVAVAIAVLHVVFVLLVCADYGDVIGCVLVTLIGPGVSRVYVVVRGLGVVDYIRLHVGRVVGRQHNGVLGKVAVVIVFVVVVLVE